jgi:hypothetical protein
MVGLVQNSGTNFHFSRQWHFLVDVAATSGAKVSASVFRRGPELSVSGDLNIRIVENGEMLKRRAGFLSASQAVAQPRSFRWRADGNAQGAAQTSSREILVHISNPVNAYDSTSELHGTLRTHKEKFIPDRSADLCGSLPTNLALQCASTYMRQARAAENAAMR